MSVPSSYQGLRVNVDRGEKIGSKTQIQFSQSGDDNANQLSSISNQEDRDSIEDSGYSASSIPPLVSQTESPDKLVIWGSEQQCMEPELRQFEILDRQEIHTFLGNRNQEENEEEDDGGSLRDEKDEGPMSISSSSTASSASTGVRRNDNDSNKVESRIQRGKEVQKRIGCHSTEELDTRVTSSIEKRDTRSGREKRKGGLTESKSETNVFVSSLSAVTLSGSLSSALDSSGEATLISMSKTNPYPNANNTTSAHTRRREAPVVTSQNSPPMHLQQKHACPQYCSQDQRHEEGSHHRNGLSSDGGVGQRRKAGFDDRVLPPRRQQLVRPLCQTEMGRSRSLAETHSHQTDTGTPSTLHHSPDPHSNGSNRKFTKSSLREPSDFSHLYNTSGVSQLQQPSQASDREAPPVERQQATTVRHNSSPSNPSTLEKRPQTQLTYRRNCSSPNRTGVDSRSSTPPHSPLRTPQGSPRRQPSMYLISRNVPGVVRHIPSGCNPAVPTSAQGYGNSCLRAPVKTNISTSGIPKAPLHNQQSSPNSSHNSPKESSPSPKLKPKGVRPKIITYVRKNPQFKPQASDGPYQVSSLPSRLSTYPHSQTPTSFKDTPKDPSKPDAESRGAPVLSASNLLYDKYRQEMQVNSFPSGMMSRNIRAPGHTNTVPPTHTHSHTAPPKLASKADNFYGTPSEVGRSTSFKGSSPEDALQSRTAAQAGGSGSLLRSGRGLRLGLGAVTRTTTGSAKGRGPGQGQRSTLVFSQPVQPVSPATSQKGQDNTDDQVFIHHAPAAPPPAPTAAAQPQAAASRSMLPKASQSGLRPPGFSSSRLPAGRLAAFGFVRSSSVSSVSSAHSADSTQSDPCRTAHRLSVSEEPPLHRVTTGTAPTDHQRGAPCRSNSLQPPSTPALPRRYLPPQPRSSPVVGRKEFQRSSEVTRSLPSSPKRLAVVPPKPQSPVQSGQRPAAAVRGSAPLGSPRRVAPLRLQQEQQENLQREKEEAQQKERERQAEEREKEEQREEVQRLQGRCDRQERQLKALRDELRKTSLGLEAFIITTQHYCLKNKTTEENQRQLSLEMQKIRDEMASNSVRWERLQREKTALEVAFERELQELQLQQETELAAVEEGLRKCHSAETEHLKAEHQSEMEELRTHQQEQVEEMTVGHQAAIQELRDMHNITMATLHEEHARTMRDLRKAHEQQKMLLEEDFEKLRLSLQDQVDTLTFQNQSLRDKAKRFEEALRRSTDEQIVDALAPYQHIEQDLKSLKEVVEMKNQQIHQQEKKISDLEKVAQKNVFLEEKVQVLQQQNEDLKARIEMNLALSRQLSEDNANLQESVEKESTEKKRLSRNNEELLWRLQTSPLMSPASSPLHRSFSTSPVPSSPLFFSSPVAGCDSPTHCHGCSQQAQYSSPSHRAATNQNLSPGPATPAHRAAVNQNFSSNPATPAHRAAVNQNSSSNPATPAHRAAVNQNSSSNPATPTHRASASRCNSNSCLSSLQR
ncbi:microtubule-associated tumor suppressor candidate 2 homolog isoform X2 [Amphiprion ocellaris]|uniref:microtubule-associated tumor suppressor candidate 2 homolog isoform X2 n=1 Tax=Amphiprion ocellaris TaxID=80972 RepID=UPI002410E819|nr:microtubule-associated tumor suppressor candidate 2 homolog isoform X2 [Amphiprion ocellaris]